MGDFEGKTVLITGAGSGIGRASAIGFAREGGTIAVSDIDAESGNATVEEIRELGGEAEFFRIDVADQASVGDGIMAVIKRFGSLEVAHNNAGIDTPPIDLLGTSRDLWDRTLAVNLTGVFNCLQAEIAHMVFTSGGTIVNTASISGLIGSYNHSAYTAAKFGVVGLTKSAAAEYIQQGVRINAVCPGAVATPFMDALEPDVLAAFKDGAPAGRLAHPDEIVEAVLWLASSKSSYLVGHALPVDGGLVGTSMSTRATDLQKG